MKRLTVSIALWVFPAVSGATVFCVDQSGAEAPGCDLVFTTVQEVNGAPLSPGDKVLFKRGQTWNSRIIVQANGTGPQPITYGSYGGGPLPVIDVNRAEPFAFHSDNRSHLIVSDIKFKDSQNNAMQFINSYGIEVSGVEVDFDLADLDGKDVFDYVGEVGNNGIAFIKGGGDITVSSSTVTNAPTMASSSRGTHQIRSTTLL